MENIKKPKNHPIHLQTTKIIISQKEIVPLQKIMVLTIVKMNPEHGLMFFYLISASDIIFELLK